ncbi:unnamed protein product [Prunus armeniaca]
MKEEHIDVHQCKVNCIHFSLAIRTRLTSSNSTCSIMRLIEINRKCLRALPAEGLLPGQDRALPTKIVPMPKASLGKFVAHQSGQGLRQSVRAFVWTSNVMLAS